MLLSVLMSPGSRLHKIDCFVIECNPLRVKSEIECSVNTQLEVRHQDLKLPLIRWQGRSGIWGLHKMKLAKFDNRIEPERKFVGVHFLRA